ncbi:type III secretion system chaperone [Pseudomonas sp. NPDC078416]|uniref:type III secretion system chaperone n=1 Tax=Pseudomonas sp. NPDC078416 TaxID=3390637 RepID=UPI003D055A5A
MNTTTHTDACIQALGKRLGTALQLENGVCALFDEGREVVIIEMPTAGDVAILHCKLSLRPDPSLYERLMRLNFDSGAMSGCWLALDEQHSVRLCTQLPLKALDELTFVEWVQGFVLQTRDVAGLLQQRPAAPAKASVHGQAQTGLSRRIG